MLNFIVGFLLGANIAVCVLCLLQMNTTEEYAKEIRYLKNESNSKN